MPRGRPRWYRRVWWNSSARGQLIQLCKQLRRPVVQDLGERTAECRLGKLLIYAPDDNTIEVYRNGEHYVTLEGMPFRIYIEGMDTLVIESKTKKIRLTFNKRIAYISE